MLCLLPLFDMSLVIYVLLAISILFDVRYREMDMVLYTSPSAKSINERVSLNENQLIFFELLVALFRILYEQK